MNIFNIEKTEEEVKKDEIIRCANYRKWLLSTIEESFLRSFRDVFDNKIVTAQEHFDFFGSNASQFLETFTATASYIKTLNPDFEVPAIPCEYTINEDGTITVIEEVV